MIASSLFTNYMSSGGSQAGLSGLLWSRLPAVTTGPFGKKNLYIEDDFLSFGLTTAIASNVGRYASSGGVYKSYEDTGDAISQLATHTGGVIEIAVAATNNNESWLQAAGGTGVFGAITSGTPKLTVFETRFQVDQIGNTHNIFIGLAEEGLAAADAFYSDTGVIADKDYIGFFAGEGAGATLKFGYNLAGQTDVVSIAALQTLVADTWYKTGWIVDPDAPPSKRLKVFFNNVEQGTYVTLAQISTITGSAFPLGEEMSFLAGLKNANAAGDLLVDWYAWFQEG